MDSQDSTTSAHASADHPRNGYAEVRALFRLRDLMPLPTGMTFKVTPILADPYAPPRISEGPSLDEDQILPPPNDWRRSAANVRLIKEQGEPYRLASEEDIRMACRLWHIDNTDEARDRLFEAYTVTEARFHFAEIAARWSVTVGCSACIDQAVARTVNTVNHAIASLSDALTFAVGFPYSPLTIERVMASHVVWVKEFSLDDELCIGHPLSLAFKADPRDELARTFPTLEFQGDQLDRMIRVLLARNGDLDVAEYFSFLAGAYRALYVDGNPSSCVILAAQACESLLDTVLLHVYWWDREDPATAGRLLCDGIVKRVQRH
jgi:hypothetical protein